VGRGRTPIANEAGGNGNSVGKGPMQGTDTHRPRMRSLRPGGETQSLKKRGPGDEIVNTLGAQTLKEMKGKQNPRAPA